LVTACVVAVWCFLFLLQAQAAGTDYLVDHVWDSEDELPSSTVTAICQTPDGYLWIGTYNGLARFDGIRFVTFDPVNTPALGHARIQDLYLDGTGTLWINTYRGGLTSYRDEHFHREWPGSSEFDLHTSLGYCRSNLLVFVTQFGVVLRRESPAQGSIPKWTALTPPGNARLLYQCAGRDGTLWFLARDGHIVRLVGDEFQDLPEQCQPGGTRTITMTTDPAGHVWAGTDKGIERWDGKVFEDMTPTNGEGAFETTMMLPTRDGGVWVLANGRLRKELNRQWTTEVAEWHGLLGYASTRSMGMHEDRAGGVWFNHYGNGLFHIAPDGHIQRFTSQEGLPGDRIWAWFEGNEGEVWVGVDRGGLARLRERRFQVIGQAEGLPARAALSVCEDRQGAMWFGTSGGGLCRWDGHQIEKLAVGNDVSANYVFSVFPQREQGLWLSAAAGEDLFVCRDGEVQRGPWEGAHGVKTILEDHEGRLWMGTKVGLTWWLPDRHRSFSRNMNATAVRALTETKAGVVWCGSDDGGLYRCEPEQLKGFRPSDTLSNQPIWSLQADEDGTIWAGTFRGGLLRFRDGKFDRLTTEQGLPSDIISGIVEDTHGKLWLATHQGICRVSKRALNDCFDGKVRQLECITYGRMDGLPTKECAGNYQPECWRAHDGRLWFATDKGMVSVQPDELKINPIPPPVVIEEMRMDGEKVAIDTPKLEVPPGRQQLEFAFTALSFISPDKVRFRYKLEGLDKDWIEAGTRRTAHYAHVPARSYKLRVMACNNDGVWNSEGTSLAFTVLPHFYETGWFLTLASLAVLGAVGAAVRSVTMRKYQLAMAQLEQKHAIERDRARIAKDIHDDLGAGLTQITLLSELARRESAQAAPNLDRITDSARQMTRAMDEIVWAVDPQHDTLTGLMDYVSAFTEEFLRVAGIRCRMDLPAELPDMRLDAEMRYNLFLALKEALNNVVKHAKATMVWLRLRVQDDSITLIVEDNGQGLPPIISSGHSDTEIDASGKPLTPLTPALSPSDGEREEKGLHPVLADGHEGEREENSGSEEAPVPVPVDGGHGAKEEKSSGRVLSGHGLTNLERRLASIGGSCTLQSAPGKGTRVELNVHLEGTPSPVMGTSGNGGEVT
jgi:signal transduction histidine kinase/ligand-binding sensor domain-containing protein